MQRAPHGTFKNLANALRTKLEGGVYFLGLLFCSRSWPLKSWFFFFFGNCECNFCLSMRVGLLKALLDSYDIYFKMLSKYTEPDGTKTNLATTSPGKDARRFEKSCQFQVIQHSSGILYISSHLQYLTAFMRRIIFFFHS